METKYFIKGKDIVDLFDVITQQEYGNNKCFPMFELLSDSNFNKYKVNNMTFLEKTGMHIVPVFGYTTYSYSDYYNVFSHLGYCLTDTGIQSVKQEENTLCQQYFDSMNYMCGTYTLMQKAKNIIGTHNYTAPTIVPKLKGMYGYGIPILSDIQGNNSLTPGTYYFCREGIETYFDTVENGKTFKLRNGAKFLTFELQAGGGGGGTSTLVSGATGGGGGAWGVVKTYIRPNTIIKLTIGKGGTKDSDGEDTLLELWDKTNPSSKQYIKLGGGKKGTTDSIGVGGTFECICDYDTESITQSNWYALMGTFTYGGNGGDLAKYGSSVSCRSINTDGYGQSLLRHLIISRPEQSGGFGENANLQKSGGGGGASTFAPGGDGKRTSPGGNGSMGSGGAGGAHKAFTTNSGGNGGDGLAIVYY